jgi:hypothetical protein
VAAHQAGAGSGVLVTTQQVAISLGATVLGTLYARLIGPVPSPFSSHCAWSSNDASLGRPGTVTKAHG